MLGIKGKLGEKEVYALEGRFHFYEGYSMKEVCYPFCSSCWAWKRWC